MDFAIIAAGEGSRLKNEGILQPKPLVQINGETLLQRLIRIFIGNRADRICVITNRQSPSVAAHVELVREQLRQRGTDIPIDLLQKDTPSSMHSLYEMTRSLSLGQRPFCLTTVDTVFDEAQFRLFVGTFERLLAADSADVLLGTTPFIDDEKPLYIAADSRNNVAGIHDAPPVGEREDDLRVSAGIYALTPTAVPILQRCVEQGEQRMRNFQRALLRGHLRVQAFNMQTVIDIDHRHDIAQAAAMLAVRS